MLLNVEADVTWMSFTTSISVKFSECGERNILNAPKGT